MNLDQILDVGERPCLGVAAENIVQAGRIGTQDSIVHATGRVAFAAASVVAPVAVAAAVLAA